MKNRFYDIVLLLLLGQTIAWADSTYTITTETELRDFASKVNNGEYSACATLGNDIACTSSDWAPIGYFTHSYTGTFDGQGYTISGIKADLSSQPIQNTSGVGFFGTIGQGGVVKNIVLKDCTFQGYYTAAGGICGINNGGRIQSCVVTGCTIGTYNDSQNGQPSGSICGSATGGAIISCYSCSNTLTGKIGETATIIGLATSASVSHCYTYQDGSWYTGTITQTSGDDSGNNYTQAQFNSGEIAWRLNQNLGTSDKKWTQTIGTDALPTFGTSTVYQFSQKESTDTIRTGAYVTRWYPVKFTLTDAQAYTVTAKADNGILTLSKLTAGDNSNTPLLITSVEGKQKGTVTLPAFSFYSNNPDSLKKRISIEGNLLIGTFHGDKIEYSVTADKYNYLLQKQNNLWAFYMLNDEYTKCADFRCFLQIPKSTNNAKYLTWTVEDSVSSIIGEPQGGNATAIETVSQHCLDDNKAEAYNIIGQHINPSTVKNGLIIINHMKVLKR